MRLALVLLLGLGVLNLLKGLDVEEAAVSFAVAVVLWLGRGSFCVRPTRSSLRAALSRVPLVVGSGLLLCGFAVWLAAPESASLGAVVRETIAALVWQPGPLDFHDELGAVDEAVGLTGVLVLAASLWMVFRPLAPPAAFPDLRLRRAAAGLVRRHGPTRSRTSSSAATSTTCSAPTGAFLGYRVEAGVLLVSGDPVGADEAIPGLFRELSLFAETRGPSHRRPGCRRTVFGLSGSNSGCAACIWVTRPSSRQRSSRSRAADPEGRVSPSRGSRTGVHGPAAGALRALATRTSRSSRT